MSDALIYCNGVNGATGDYTIAPRPLEDFADHAMLVDPRADPLALKRAAAAKEAHWGLPWNLDPADVSSAGWGIVFHRDESAEVRRELEPLIEHRRAGVDPTRFKVLEYQPNETPARWLSRHGVVSGTIVPKKVPYYLLIVGTPDLIPFEFSQDLDVEYAVGRLGFETAVEYGRYVDSLLRYETATRPPGSRRAVFFGTHHDDATRLSAEFLVEPLATSSAESAGMNVAAGAGFSPILKLGDFGASKDDLLSIFRAGTDSEPPSFLMTATHGIEFPAGHPEQSGTQGALLCQEWPGPPGVSPEHYLRADEIPADARIHGLVAVLFACFSAGTPSHDRFWRQRADGQPTPLAPKPFVSALPQRLLAHPGGGALACLGHVERAWGTSIMNDQAGDRLELWRRLVGSVLAGRPVGLALGELNESYAGASVALTSAEEQRTLGYPTDRRSLARLWLERNDSAGYALLGDPAARLRVDRLT